MNKQLRIRTTLAVVAVLTILAFSACDLLTPPVSINDRLTAFAAELSKADRSNVYSNLDTSSTSYNAAKTAAFWDALFVKDGAYTVSAIDASVPTAVTAKLTSVTKIFDATVTFNMSSTGTINLVYTIKSISYPINGTQTTVFQ